MPTPLQTTKEIACLCGIFLIALVVAIAGEELLARDSISSTAGEIITFFSFGLVAAGLVTTQFKIYFLKRRIRSGSYTEEQVEAARTFINSKLLKIIPWASYLFTVTVVAILLRLKRPDAAIVFAITAPIWITLNQLRGCIDEVLGLTKATWRRARFATETTAILPPPRS
jgi:hypothetical protein